MKGILVVRSKGQAVRKRISHGTSNELWIATGSATEINSTIRVGLLLNWTLLHRFQKVESSYSFMQCNCLIACVVCSRGRGVVLWLKDEVVVVVV